MPITCEDRKDLIQLLALGALDERESAPLRDHLDGGCPTCAAALSEAQAVAAQLPWALQREPAPAGVRTRLLARVAADLRARPSLAHRSHVADWARALTAGALAASVAFAASYVAFQHRTDELRRQVTRLRSEITNLRTAQEGQTQVIQALHVPATLVAQLDATPDAPGSAAHITADAAHGTWQLAASGLKPLPAGKVYELWYVIDNQPKPVGLFAPDPFGNAVATLPLPRDATRIAVAAVTLEAVGGSATPTSALLLKGQLVK